MRFPDWLVYTLIVVITLAWAASLFASFFIAGYQIPESINIPFGAVVTVLILGKRNSNGGGGSE